MTDREPNRRLILSVLVLGTVVSIAIWLSLVFAHPHPWVRLFMSITAVAIQVRVLTAAIRGR
jgi:hypothetical protein